MKPFPVVPLDLSMLTSAVPPRQHRVLIMRFLLFECIELGDAGFGC